MIFKKLFGQKQPSVDPQQQKELERKKNQFDIQISKQQLERKIEENQNKMENLERQIREKTQVSLAARHSTQKSRAQRQSDDGFGRDKIDEGANHQDERLFNNPAEEYDQPGFGRYRQ